MAPASVSASGATLASRKDTTFVGRGGADNIAAAAKCKSNVDWSVARCTDPWRPRCVSRCIGDLVSSLIGVVEVKLFLLLLPDVVPVDHSLLFAVGAVAAA